MRYNMYVHIDKLGAAQQHGPRDSKATALIQKSIAKRDKHMQYLYYNLVDKPCRPSESDVVVGKYLTMWIRGEGKASGWGGE